MRVLHVITDTNMGGAGRYLLTLLAQPSFRRIEVYVACPAGELQRRIDALGVSRIDIGGKDVSLSLPLVAELARAIRRVDPDLVHTHSCLSARIASRLLGIPVVYTKHNVSSIPPAERAAEGAGPWGGAAGRLFRMMVARLFSNAVIAVSEVVREDLIKSGVPASMVATIPNGVDLAAFPRPARRLAGPGKKDDVGAIGVTVGTAARLHPQKALDVMIEAARIVVDAAPGTRFLIAGTGPSEAELRRKIQRLQLGSYVEMAGFVEDVPGFLRQLDVYVLSSRYEGLPFAVLEAMAARLPVVATNVGGVPEAVVDGVTGILVPPGDSRLLAEGILRLIRDPQMAARMGMAGRARVEEMFSAEAMATRTIEIYERCCAGTASSLRRQSRGPKGGSGRKSGFGV